LYLVTPFIPLFVLELVGGDPIAAAAWSGIALGISPLMTAVVCPFWGSVAERYGARPAMMRALAMAPCLVVLVVGRNGRAAAVARRQERLPDGNA
jgi:DHA1 family multidrug resistance protein-like MFS transporter